MASEINTISDISDLVLHGMMYKEDYFRHIIPFMKKDYFEEETQKIIFEEVNKFSKQYNARITPTALMINVEKQKGLSEDQFRTVEQKINDLKNHESSGEQVEERWLVESTEKWCKDRAFYSVLFDAANAINSKKDVSTLGIPELMSEALGISFDTSIGHDFLNDAEERYEFYHKVENKIPFRIELMNRITKGGIVSKTLTCWMSTETGGFKSGTMCDHAAFLLQSGFDVLYISMEMSEEKIAERIDANLMNLEIDYVNLLPKATYMRHVEEVRSKCTGRLIIKEFPTSTAHAGHFRFLLKELAQKKNFRPKVVFIDYLNICASTRMNVANCNSYTYVKSIAEELRGLAVEMDFACISATQGNRGAIGSTDVGLGDVSESIGLPATCDLFMGIITTDQLNKMNQLMFKQLKNRYGDATKFKTFVVGVNKAKMQLFDITQNTSPSQTTGLPIVPVGNGIDQFDTGTGEVSVIASKKAKFDDFKF